MSLRIGIDIDGTLADLSAAYREVEARLLKDRPGGMAAESPAEATGEQLTVGLHDGRSDETIGRDSARRPRPEDRAGREKIRDATRRQELVWHAIRDTLDFWVGLSPIEPGVVGRLFDVSRARGWEIFFMTQRPETRGETVQRQTQRWLIAEGFETPSVLSLRGARGHACAALELDVLIDDLPKNCVDALSESNCRPVLILRDPHDAGRPAAERLGIGIVESVNAAIDLLEANSSPRQPQSVITRLLQKLQRKTQNRPGSGGNKPA